MTLKMKESKNYLKFKFEMFTSETFTFDVYGKVNVDVRTPNTDSYN
jgi:hypothetical protein